ncbi:hypothetical protein Athai_01510 [Actinocatenispora thailandica]|uniref:DUF4878 domain-containing protein n=1 Tax=Actinocatenispora thailandica TaxID=227318 RepID=A0A7R7HUY9_9ACTN|nr:hypothetical protein [Actinocatenispora thailandica]BCJ32648.1 hypothetical protein Athai_01510 [Actinocatenispora thailandica]
MTQPPTTSAPPSTPRRLKPPLRRTPVSLLLFLLAGFGCLIAVLAATIVIYIGRSAYQAGHQVSPTQAVDGLLDAALNEHDASATDKYLCGDASVRSKVHGVVRRIKTFEKKNPGTFLTYEWSVRKVWQRRGRALVAAQVRAKTTASGSSTNNPEQRWSFAMRDQGGWKVCALTIPEN